MLAVTSRCIQPLLFNLTIYCNITHDNYLILFNSRSTGICYETIFCDVPEPLFSIAGPYRPTTRIYGNCIVYTICMTNTVNESWQCSPTASRTFFGHMHCVADAPLYTGMFM